MISREMGRDSSGSFGNEGQELVSGSQSDGLPVPTCANSDLFFLGEDVSKVVLQERDSASSELTFESAVKGDFSGLRLEAFMVVDQATPEENEAMRWLEEEQKLVLDHIASFIVQQTRHLEWHQGAIELQFEHMRTAMASMARKSGSFSSGGDKYGACDSPRSQVDLKSVLSDESQSGLDVLPVVQKRSTNRHALRKSWLSNSICLSEHLAQDNEEMARKIHMAYESAAKKMNQKTKLMLIRDRLGRASQQTYKANRVGCVQFDGLVEGYRFQSMVASIIILNAVFIGITSDMAMQRAVSSFANQNAGTHADVQGPLWSVVCDFIFNFVFIAELVLRIVILDTRFFLGADWKWNLFDSCLVLLSIVEMMLSGVGYTTNFMRVLRVVRVTRSLRMIRLVRFTHLVRKLRLMTVAIVNCGMMLMWAVLVLLIVIFLFSVVFLNALSQYIADAPVGNEYVDDMLVFFSSLLMTMVTLFMAVAGGIDWWDVMRLLLEVSPGYAVVFMLFVIITVLAVLNVINAIFVNDAIESTRTDHDLRMSGELEETSLMLQRLTAIFAMMESPYGTGMLTEQCFAEQVEREDVKMQFALLGLYFSQGPHFFRLLDVDGNGELCIDEFVMGCLRLKGGALLIDSNVMIRDTRTLVASTARTNRKVMESLATAMAAVVERLDALQPDSRFRTDMGVVGVTTAAQTLGSKSLRSMISVSSQ